MMTIDEALVAEAKDWEVRLQVSPIVEGVVQPFLRGTPVEEAQHVLAAEVRRLRWKLVEVSMLRQEEARVARETPSPYDASVRRKRR